MGNKILGILAVLGFLLLLSVGAIGVYLYLTYFTPRACGSDILCFQRAYADSCHDASYSAEINLGSMAKYKADYDMHNLEPGTCRVFVVVTDYQILDPSRLSLALKDEISTSRGKSETCLLSYPQNIGSYTSVQKENLAAQFDPERIAFTVYIDPVSTPYCTGSLQNHLSLMNALSQEASAAAQSNQYP